MTPDQEKRLNNLAQELALFQQAQLKRNADYVSYETLALQGKYLSERLAEAEKRVAVLEEARQKQISINTELLKDKKPLEISIENIWGLFKRK